MRRSSLSLLLVTLAACAATPEADAPDEATGTSQQAGTYFPISLIAGPGPAGANPLYEGISGFAYLFSDRKIGFADFEALVTDATKTMPGSLAPPSMLADAATFLATARANAPPHRLGSEGARVVHVYSDAPVYIVNGFALLPGEDGKPIDPTRFKLDGSPDPALEKLCFDQRSRCIPLSREHVQNRKTAAVLIAARSIVVRGPTQTDGMSLLLMSENLLADGGSIDLSPRTQAPYLTPSTAATMNATDVLVYRGMPGSPEVKVANLTLAEVAANEDLAWQLARARAATPTSPDSTRGLAGMDAGSLLALAFRSTPMQAVSRGQDGARGAYGKNGSFMCPETFPGGAVLNGAKVWTCEVPSSEPARCATDCGTMTVPQDGGSGGPAGASGFIRVYEVAKIGDRCAFTEATVRDDAPRHARVQGDGALGYGRTCTNDATALDGSVPDCASDACAADPHVLVCAPRAVPPGTPRVSDGDSSCGATPGATKGDSFYVMTGSAGPGGFGGNAATALCMDQPDRPGAPVNRSIAIHCLGTSGGARGSAAPSPATRDWAFSANNRQTWSRDAWAIALDRLLPLEISRRVAVAHHRFAQGERAAARTRYLEARSLTASNQLRSAAGKSAGVLQDCADGAVVSGGLEPICAIRSEIDRALVALSRGDDFFGYPANYVVPQSLSSAKLVTWAKEEITHAQSVVSTVQLGARLQNLATDFDARWTTALDAQMAELDARIAPTGSLSVALANAQKDQADAESELRALVTQIADDSYMLSVLAPPEVDSMAELVATVVKAGVSYGFGTIAPGSEKLIDELGKKVKADPYIYARYVTSSDAEIDLDLRRLGLNMDRRAAVMRMREVSRALGRAYREQDHIRSQIAEARASSMRLAYGKAQFATNRFGTQKLDLLLQASYVAALSSTRRAAEYVYLAKKAVERDQVLYAVKPGGTVVNGLDGILAPYANGARSADDVDLRFDNLDAYRNRVLALEGELAKPRWPVHGALTRVVPITPEMATTSKSGAAVYRVQVPVSLDAVTSAGYVGTRAHKLRDVEMLVDTTARSGMGTARMERSSDEVYWLGEPGGGAPTFAGFVGFSTPRRGVAGGGTLEGPLKTYFGDPTYDPSPPAQWGLCVGTAAENDAVLTTGSSKAALCRMSAAGTVGLPYAGRALLGVYTFEVPAADVATNSAMRVRFSFDAQWTSEMSALTGYDEPEGKDQPLPDGVYRRSGEKESYRITGSTICQIPAWAGDQLDEERVRHVEASAYVWLGKSDLGQCAPQNSTFPVKAIKNEGLCMDVMGGSSADQTPVWTYGCHGGPAQQWSLTAAGEIKGLGGKCLDVQWGSSALGTPVWMYTCNGGGAQRWWVMPNGQIRGLGGNCLTVPSPGTPQSALVMGACTDPPTPGNRIVVEHGVLTIVPVFP